MWRIRRQSVDDTDTHVYASGYEYIDKHANADRIPNSNGHADARVAGQP